MFEIIFPKALVQNLAIFLLQSAKSLCQLFPLSVYFHSSCISLGGLANFHVLHFDQLIVFTLLNDFVYQRVTYYQPFEGVINLNRSIQWLFLTLMLILAFVWLVCLSWVVLRVIILLLLLMIMFLVVNITIYSFTFFALIRSSFCLF
jgi:hypothetical protein